MRDKNRERHGGPFWGLQRRAITFGVVVLAVQIVVFGSLALMLNQAQQSALRLAYSHRMLTSCALLISYFDDVLHCFLLSAATGNQPAEERLLELFKKIPSTIDELQSVQPASDQDASEIKAIAKAAKFVVQRVEALHYRYQSAKNNSDKVLDAINELRLDAYPYYRDLLELERKFYDRHQLLKSQYKVQTDPNRLFQTFLFVVLGTNFTLTIAGIVVFSKSIVRRLYLIADNFRRFAAKRELKPCQTGGDEIALLDEQFHELCQAVQEAHSREQYIFANMPVALISCGADGKIESFNSRAPDLVLTGQIKDISQLFLEAFSPMAEPVQQQPSGPTRMHARAADGKISPYEVTVSSYLYEHELKQLYAMLDVSDREKIEKLREEFINIVSHDIRTPLTSLAACFSMLEDGVLGPLSDDGQRYIDRGHLLIETLIDLTGNLLNIARIESGEFKLYRRRCQTSDIIERAVSSVIPQAEDRGIEIEVKATKLEVFADPDRVVQILMNFLSNAVKYTPPGKRVTVQAEEMPSSVRISVHDEGPGIPIELQTVIFDRFKQAQPEDQQRGTGLGLAICSLLAQEHGGSVGVISEESQGSIFWLELPQQEKSTNSNAILSAPTGHE